MKHPRHTLEESDGKKTVTDHQYSTESVDGRKTVNPRTYSTPREVRIVGAAVASMKDSAAAESKKDWDSDTLQARVPQAQIQAIAGAVAEKGGPHLLVTLSTVAATTAEDRAHLQLVPRTMRTKKRATGNQREDTAAGEMKTCLAPGIVIRLMHSPDESATSLKTKEGVCLLTRRHMMEQVILMIT